MFVFLNHMGRFLVVKVVLGCVYSFAAFCFGSVLFLRSIECRWGSCRLIFHGVFIHFPVGGVELIFSLGQACCCEHSLPCARVSPGHVGGTCWVQGHAPKWACPQPSSSAKSSISSQRKPLTQSITINDFIVRGFQGFWSTFV